MTVLSKYERLECAGVWRASSQAQGVNVFVTLGDATLVLRDSSDTALAHWSLPALRRLNPGGNPAIFTPDPEGEETLELDDTAMIEAIRTVQKAVSRGRPHPGRLRGTIFTALMVVVLALGIFWLPDALVRHTASVLPQATQSDIGYRTLAALEPVAGRPCRTLFGERALNELQVTILGEAPWEVAVLPGGPAISAGLPGGLILVHKSLVEDTETPEALAGAILVEASQTVGTDPIIDLMQSAGPWATLGLLTRGQISDKEIQRYARNLLFPQVSAEPSDLLMARFQKIGLSTAPFARVVDPTGERTLPLLEVDPFPEGSTVTLLDDGSWLHLKSICDAKG